jgi:hypothetical protein
MARPELGIPDWVSAVCRRPSDIILEESHLACRGSLEEATAICFQYSEGN